MCLSSIVSSVHCGADQRGDPLGRARACRVVIPIARARAASVGCRSLWCKWAVMWPGESVGKDLPPPSLPLPGTEFLIRQRALCTGKRHFVWVGLLPQPWLSWLSPQPKANGVRPVPLPVALPVADELITMMHDVTLALIYYYCASMTKSVKFNLITRVTRQRPHPAALYCTQFSRRFKSRASKAH